MTPIEELTAREQAESARSRALAEARHKAELGVVPEVVQGDEGPLPPSPAPSPPTPVATPTAPTDKLTAFFKHIKEEIEDETK
jgi:hypothetical protein